MNPNSDSGDKNNLQFYGLVMMAVTELVVTILLFIWVGKKLDQMQHKNSLYMAGGAILGSVVGFVRLIQRLQRLMK